MSTRAGGSIDKLPYGFQKKQRSPNVARKKRNLNASVDLNTSKSFAEDNSTHSRNLSVDFGKISDLKSSNAAFASNVNST